MSLKHITDGLSSTMSDGVAVIANDSLNPQSQ